MKHFPIFLSVENRRILLSGGGEAALAKLRLLLKTEARVEVFTETPAPEIAAWADEGRLTLHRRALAPADLPGAVLVYAADEDEVQDARIKAMADRAGLLVNIVDNLHDSAFITPAIVDRDPVTVAIGTEGAAPVLARAIKRDLEEKLPVTLGTLARIGKAFRGAVEALPFGRKRRDFWAEYYFDTGPKALAERGEQGVKDGLRALLAEHLTAAPREGHVALVGAGPGDPELLTLKARKALDEADVIIHDRLVAPEILELARREATLLDVGKQGFGRHTPQAEIARLMVEHAAKGLQVVRLKSGDPVIYGRLDEEIEALDAAGISWSIVPGITSASAAAAGIGQSLTRRGRNSALRVLTGHDTEGFAEQDWAALARPGTVAAIYMAKKGARFLQGRLLMHGAPAATPVTIVENASRPNQRTVASTLATLAADLDNADLTGPAILLYGLALRAAEARLPDLQELANAP
ncbi:siroheme synthase CysG [Nioella sediminis]|uniref:siroheme synthase CysG n=1 Tax=Nioella sediminis TaxID=1912092 RepID=UPI0008FD3C5C|nr:siroheme synthase CysG [Nioella sediminis]TBX26126.1 uroporphyrin-III methyltransferase [Roseovarius sp. JS7-11]